MRRGVRGARVRGCEACGRAVLCRRDPAAARASRSLAQGRGRVAAPPAPPGRPAAPVDLTGTWVSVVTEDWQWRMRTPAKGDTMSVPLNGEGRSGQLVGAVDGRPLRGVRRRRPHADAAAAEDQLAGRPDAEDRDPTPASRRGCCSFAKPGAAAAPVSGARRHARCRARRSPNGSAAAARSTRSSSAAPAPRLRGGERSRSRRPTSLPGWLRRNGVPYSQNAKITEYFTR